MNPHKADMNEMDELRDTAERYRIASLKYEAQAMRWRTVAEGLAEIVQCGKDDPPERWPTDEQMDAALAAFERAKRDTK